MPTSHIRHFVWDVGIKYDTTLEYSIKRLRSNRIFNIQRHDRRLLAEYATLYVLCFCLLFSIF